MLSRWVWSEWLSEGWELQRVQFMTLYRVFLLRVVDLELLATDGDPTKLIGQFATIFVTVSFFLTIPVLFIGMGGGKLPASAAWMFEHFLIETSMTVAGLIGVLNWDSAFPDKRDVLVLAPLPVRMSTFVLAKVAALFAAPMLSVVALNVFTGVAWPLVFISRTGFLGDLRAWPAYAATVLLAGGFLVLTMVGVQGLAANLLPRQIFLRVSAFLQAGLLCGLLSVYFLEPSMHTPTALLSPVNQRWLAWLPSYWFLGLFHQLNGSIGLAAEPLARQALEPLARRAWVGLGAASGGAGAALLLSYFRTLPKIVEQPDILSGTRGLNWLPRRAGGLRGAIVLFTVRALLRSRQHRMILSFYIGIGVAIVLGYIETKFVGLRAAGAQGLSPAYLLASLLTMLLAVLAIRVVASIPMTLRANWIFRVTEVRAAREYQRSVRLAWLAVSVLPVTVVLAGALWSATSWRLVAGHLATMLVLGMVLVEVCLLGFEKVPFTCSYLPGKGNLHFAFWACLFFMIRFLKDVAEFEGRMLLHHASLMWMLAALGLVVAVLRGWNEGRVRGEGGVRFEEEDETGMVSLGLR